MKIFDQYKGLRKEVYVLFISRVVTAMGSMLWAMLTLICKKKLGMNPEEISTWMVVFSIASLPLEVIGGKIADKYNKKKIIIATDIIESIVYIATFLVPLTKTSLAICLGASMLENLSGPSYDTLLADLTSSKDRERANSLLYFGCNLGMILTPIVSGFLVNYNVNLVFLVTGVSTIIALVIESLFLKNITPEENNENVYEERQENVSIFKVLKENKAILIILLLMALQSLSYSEWNFLIPLDLENVYGDNGSIIYGITSSINCAVVVFFTAIITKLIEKRQDIHKYRDSMILFALGYVIFVLFVKTYWMCYVALVVFTFGEIMATISSNPIITHRIPASHRGRILAASYILNNIVYAIGQKGIAILYNRFSSIAAWIAVIGLNVFIYVALLVYGIYDKKRFPKLYDGTTMED